MKKDWTGQKFNKLTFVRPTDKRDARGAVLCEVQCDCGKLRLVSPSSVSKGRLKSCGCYKISAIPKDWTNSQFGMLTILSISNSKRGKSYLWNAMCQCGKACLVLPGTCVAGKTLSCGCLQKQAASLTGKNNRQYDPVISSARIVWSNAYNDGDIAFEQFLELSAQPCDYCGVLPYRTVNAGANADSSDYQKGNGNFTYNGLDRLDSSKPHTVDNVVPCCSECNWAKGKRTRQEFIDHIERVHAHLHRVS